MRLKKNINAIIFLAAILPMISCSVRPQDATQLSEEAPIFPDYKEVTIPVNIAPLNFSFLGEGKAVLIAGDKVVRSHRGCSNLEAGNGKNSFQDAGKRVRFP